MAEGLITPDQLRRITEEKEMAYAREALEKKRKADQERHHLREAFMSRDLHPDVYERVSRRSKAPPSAVSGRYWSCASPASFAPMAGVRSTIQSPIGRTR